MTEYTSIRVTMDAYESAKEAKRDNETWNEYFQRCTDSPPEERHFVDADELANIERTVNAIEDRIGSLENSVDSLTP